MVRKLTRHILLMLSRPIVGLLVICLGSVSATAVAAPGRAWQAPSPSAPREVSLTRIVSVLEARMPGHELSEKAKAKLLTLDDRQIRTAASLAERVAEEGHTAAAETAFLLLTILITLS